MTTRQKMYAGSAIVIGLGLFTAGCATAKAPDEAAVLTNYANLAEAMFGDAISTAENLQIAVDKLIAQPNDANLTAARESWINARPSYMRTEVFRFGNPEVDDLEGLVCIRQFGTEDDVEQPFDRLERALVRRRDGLPALQLQQRTAGDGVDRLDPAVHQDRELAETDDVEGRRILGRAQGARDVAHGEKKGEEGEVLLHAREGRGRRRRATKAKRCRLNCHSSPRVIMVQAM